MESTAERVQPLLTTHHSHFHPRWCAAGTCQLLRFSWLFAPEAHCNAKQRQGQGKGKFSCGGL